MKFALENRHQYASVNELQAATTRYLQSGSRDTDPEYGSFVVSFVIGPIIAFLIGKIAQWVWDHCRGTSDQQMEAFRVPPPSITRSVAQTSSN